MSHNQNNRLNTADAIIPVIKFVKWTYIPYLIILFLHFLDSLVKNPTNLLEATKIFMDFSGWGYLIIFGPFILIVTGINYFISQANLDNIPKDTTLYESITQPTMEYGPIKIIFSKPSEETDKVEETETEEFQNLEII